MSCLLDIVIEAQTHVVRQAVLTITSCFRMIELGDIQGTLFDQPSGT